MREKFRITQSSETLAGKIGYINQRIVFELEQSSAF